MSKFINFCFQVHGFVIGGIAFAIDAKDAKAVNNNYSFVNSCLF